jgi:hypothetical protein
VNVRLVFAPAHIVVVPEMLAVGSGLTVITALPVRFACGAVTVQAGNAVLVMLTIVYVVVEAGLTFVVAPLTILFNVKFEVPSVYTTS